MRPMVLVLDDDEGTRCALCHLLKAHGYATVMASSVLEADALIRNIQPRLVILDLALSDVANVPSGWDCAKNIRSTQDPAISSIPIILLTGYFGDSEVHRMAKELGDTHVLPKPMVDTERFLTKVRQLIGRGDE